MTRVPCWGSMNTNFVQRWSDGRIVLPDQYVNDTLMKRLRMVTRCAAARNFYIHEFTDFNQNVIRIFVEVLGIYEFYESGGQILFESVDLDTHICYFLGSYPQLWLDPQQGPVGYFQGIYHNVRPIGYDEIDAYDKEMLLDEWKRKQYRIDFGKDWFQTLPKSKQFMGRRWFTLQDCLGKTYKKAYREEIGRRVPPTIKNIFPGGPIGGLTLPPIDRPPSGHPKPQDNKFNLTLGYGWTSPGRPDGILLTLDLWQER